MKKLFALLLFLPSAAFADIKQEFVTSAQITVDMPYVVTNKVGTTYSLSGNNITPSVTVGDTTTSGKIGGINVRLVNGVPAMIQTDTTVTTSVVQPFKTESVIMGDATPSAVTPSSGIAALPVLGGSDYYWIRRYCWISRFNVIEFWSPYLYRRWIRYKLHRIY